MFLQSQTISRKIFSNILFSSLFLYTFTSCSVLSSFFKCSKIPFIYTFFFYFLPILPKYIFSLLIPSFFFFILFFFFYIPLLLVVFYLLFLNAPIFLLYIHFSITSFLFCLNTYSPFLYLLFSFLIFYSTPVLILFFRYYFYIRFFSL